jgi:bifunctional polynucleotide phosphatase/kinase
MFAARLQIDNSNGFFDQMQHSDRDALGALTVCTTDVEPSDKHDDKRIRIDVASASSEKEQKGQVMLYNAKLWEKTLQSFDLSQLSTTYKDACLPKGWKSFSSVIFHETEKLQASEKIAAFDFDGCLVKTDVRRTGAHAWSLLFPSIPEKFQKYHNDGYKLVSDLDTPVPTSFLCSFISLCPVAIYLLA